MTTETATRSPSELAAALGDALRAARRERGLSAQHLADQTLGTACEVSRNTITNLENHRRESVDLAEALSLASALGLTLDGLLPRIGSGYDAGFRAGVAAARKALEAVAP